MKSLNFFLEVQETGYPAEYKQPQESQAIKFFHTSSKKFLVWKIVFVKKIWDSYKTILGKLSDWFCQTDAKKKKN